MKIGSIAATLIALIGLPVVSAAQVVEPVCVPSNQNSRVEGTVVGATGGPLIGGAVGNKGEVVGGTGGPVAANAIPGAANQPCPPGYYHPPPPPGPGNRPDFWSGAPTDLRQRVDFMEGRIVHDADTGRLKATLAHRAYDELRSIRSTVRDLKERDSGLTPEDKTYIQARLDHLAGTLQEMERAAH